MTNAARVVGEYSMHHVSYSYCSLGSTYLSL